MATIVSKVGVVALAVSCLLSSVKGQTIESAQFVETVEPPGSVDGEILASRSVVTINCELSEDTDELELKLLENWRAVNQHGAVPITSVTWKPTRSRSVKLKGNFSPDDNLTVVFRNTASAVVLRSPNSLQRNDWKFGVGGGLDLSVERLTSVAARYSVDYDLAVDILRRQLSTPGGLFWINSVALGVESVGRFGNTPEVRNGTQSALSISLRPFYYLGDLIYQASLSGSYLFETAMDTGSGSIVTVLNRAPSFRVRFEVPYSNYPMYALHSSTGYARLAMPLTVTLQRVGTGKDQNDLSILPRWDIHLQYELAFSPYLIIQGEWARTAFDTPRALLGNSTSYYSVAVAQDLDVVKQSLGFLKLLLGDSEEIRGKHFIFYRISSGAQAPAFQQMNQQSFGFGTYF